MVLRRVSESSSSPTPTSASPTVERSTRSTRATHSSSTSASVLLVESTATDFDLRRPVKKYLDSIKYPANGKPCTSFCSSLCSCSLRCFYHRQRSLHRIHGRGRSPDTSLRRHLRVGAFTFLQTALCSRFALPSYPEDKKSKSGKLRLLYEGFPMAFLVEQVRLLLRSFLLPR